MFLSRSLVRIAVPTILVLGQSRQNFALVLIGLLLVAGEIDPPDYSVIVSYCIHIICF